MSQYFDRNLIREELLPLYDMSREIDLDNLAAERKLEEEVLSMLKVPETDDVKISNRIIAGCDNHPELRIRVYEPSGDKRRENGPGMLYIHGGGYVLGSPEAYDQCCISYCQKAGFTVVSVDYRLAPEAPYPSGLEDCYKAWEWLVSNGPEVGADPKRLVILGSSAGGGLTAALSLLIRDRGGQQPRMQFPLYPMIDHRNITKSSHSVIDPKCWNRSNNIKAWKLYLDECIDEIPAYASPAIAEDFTGLPNTVTFIGSLDPFRSEALTYIDDLCEAGVEAEIHVYPGCFHGFDVFMPDAEISKRAMEDIYQALAGI